MLLCFCFIKQGFYGSPPSAFRHGKFPRHLNVFFSGGKIYAIAQLLELLLCLVRYTALSALALASFSHPIRAVSYGCLTWVNRKLESFLCNFNICNDRERKTFFFVFLFFFSFSVSVWEKFPVANCFLLSTECREDASWTETQLNGARQLRRVKRGEKTRLNAERRRKIKIISNEKKLKHIRKLSSFLLRRLATRFCFYLFASLQVLR